MAAERDAAVTQPFIGGLELSRLSFEDTVRPLLDTHFPGLAYSAARIAGGSDVLGFDTPRSTDHGWGPRLELFLASSDFERAADNVGRLLSEKLPPESHGYSTHFSSPDIGNAWMEYTDSGPITHGVAITTVERFFADYLGIDPRQAISPRDWLVLPQQRLRTLTAGRVYYDGLGALEPIRAALAYYPRDVWIYLLACQWRRIDQEEPFMARAGDVGDEVGSHLIAARLVRDLMRLGFMMERQYVPYSKWLGTAFNQLSCAPRLTPFLRAALESRDWKTREAQLSKAYELMAELHNALGLTLPLPAAVSQFHDRPYRVIHSGRFAEALRAAITDESVRQLPPYLGSVDQFADSTDVLTDPTHLRKLKQVYD